MEPLQLQKAFDLLPMKMLNACLEGPLFNFLDWLGLCRVNRNFGPPERPHLERKGFKLYVYTREEARVTSNLKLGNGQHTHFVYFVFDLK